jgi:lysyl-tRNA synthetase class 2
VDDNRRRRAAGLPERPIDEHLLAALEAGMPAAAGVALGVDRLLLVLTGSRHLREVIAFAGDRA